MKPKLTPRDIAGLAIVVAAMVTIGAGTYWILCFLAEMLGKQVR